MTPRVKLFLKILVVCLILSAVVGMVKDGPQTIGPMLVLCGVGWAFWRFLIFLRAFLRPIGKKVDDTIGPRVNEAANKLDAHIDQSLRTAGLGNVADFSKTLGKTFTGIRSAVDSAMDSTEQKIKTKN